MNRLFVGDSRDLLWHLPDDFVDLCVTSPPYYNARKYDNSKLFKDEDEWLDFCLKILSGIKETMKKDGVIWWNSGPGYKNNRRLTVIYEIILELKGYGVRKC